MHLGGWGRLIHKKRNWFEKWLLPVETHLFCLFILLIPIFMYLPDFKIWGRRKKDDRNTHNIKYYTHSLFINIFIGHNVRWDRLYQCKLDRCCRSWYQVGELLFKTISKGNICSWKSNIGKVFLQVSFRTYLISVLEYFTHFTFRMHAWASESASLSVRRVYICFVAGY